MIFEKQNNILNNPPDPFTKTPEQLQEQSRLEEEFDKKYSFLKEIINDKTIFSKLRGLFLMNGGNFEQSLDSTTQSLNLSDEEKKEFKDIIISYINSDKDSFKPKESQNQEINKQNELNIEEKKEFIIINRFYNDGKISTEEFENIKTGLKEKKDIKELLNNIGDSKIKQEISVILNGLQNPETKKENTVNFLDDFKEISGNKIDLEKDNILRIISENYIRIYDNNGEINLDKSFSNAVKLAKAEILEKSPNIKRDTESFKKAIDYINSGNHKLEYIGLSILFKEGNQGDAIGKKLDDDAKLAIDNGQNKDKINEYRQKIQELLAKSAENKEKQQQKLKELQRQIQEESKDDDSHYKLFEELFNNPTGKENPTS